MAKKTKAKGKQVKVRGRKTTQSLTQAIEVTRFVAGAGGGQGRARTGVTTTYVRRTGPGDAAELKRATLYFPAALFVAMRLEAVRRGVPVSTFVAGLVQRELERGVVTP